MLHFQDSVILFKYDDQTCDKPDHWNASEKRFNSVQFYSYRPRSQ